MIAVRTTRRRTVIAGIGLCAAAQIRTQAAPASGRPPPSARAFRSPAVEAELVRVAAKIADPGLRRLFENAFPNTLDTTVRLSGSDAALDTFVVTGDIDAMWLRDSSCQVRPYLHLARNDPALKRLFAGLIRRQARSILIDPYANAFTLASSASTNLEWAKHDETEMRPGVAERKWEVDSLAHVLRLAHDYWRATGDVAPFDAEWREAFELCIATYRAQQRKDGPGPYRFRRLTLNPGDTVPGDGFGAPTRKVGLIHAMFRPSDDACVLPFLIPANLFAASALRQAAAVAREACRDAALAERARDLATEIDEAARRYGRMHDASGAEVLAYEVDGFGNALFIDDANVPSLSSLGYLGVLDGNDPLFRRTEAAAWSGRNPYFHRGRTAEGIGGPHVGVGWIWPMSLIVRALSSDDDVVILHALRTLKRTDGGADFVHEAFDADDPTRFTRPWFAWGNSLFAELILQLAAQRPAVLAAA